jgi:signal transduction histidine kinase/CheY-like chemotaxis protein
MVDGAIAREPDGWSVNEEVQATYVQTMVALLIGAGALLLVLTESLRLPWSVQRLAVYLTLWPLAVIAVGFKRKWAMHLGLVLGLALLIGLVWLSTDDERVWVLLLVPVTAASLLGSTRLGGVAALATSVLLVWRLPPWVGDWSLACVMALLALWSAQIAVRCAARGAVESTRWALEHYTAMRSVLDEALDQRVELKQARDDLVQANGQLERLAERLALMTEVAEEANRTKERFLANVSHELRTPLNMIIGFSEMITQSPDVYEANLPGALLADITVIRRNSQHLASLVDDILDLSRTEAGHLALAREWLSLEEVVQEAVDAVAPLFANKGLYLRVESARQLPETYCDRTRIRQVVLNLLSNAGRFTTEGGVQITLSSDASGVLCCVADTGRGIPSEDRERVFEPFYQTSSQTLRRRDGTGLGLSISRSLIELHGGTLWLESEPGKGTSFYFQLPIAQTTGGPPPLSRWFSTYGAYEQRDRPTRAPHPQLKPRLVVLEAGTALAKTLRRHAGEADIVGVRTMEAAVAELDREPADVLVVNNELAEVVSRQLVGLNRLPHGTPAAVCWMPADDEIAAELGVTRYLVKPIDRDELLECFAARGRAVESILIVDDDPEAVQMLARMILTAPRPYQVLRASRPRRALELMRERQPDLVLLDMYMPEMSGFELLRIKAQDPAIAKIEVIAISAHDPTMSLGRGNSLTLLHRAPLAMDDLLDGVQLLRDSTRRGRPAERPARAETSRA